MHKLAQPLMIGLLAVGLTAANLVAVSNPASAAETQSIVNGIVYSFDGTSAAYVSGYDATLGASATIASTVSIGGNSYAVTAIGDGAFFGDDSLQTVVIGSSVRSIGDYAFDSSALSGLTLGNSVVEIGSYAFANTQLNTLVVPNSVTKIGEGAFFNVDTLTSATFGTGLAAIGSCAFALTSVVHLNFPASLRTLGDDAFYGDADLVDASFAAGISIIGSWAFAQSGLTQVHFAGLVPNLGEDAFYQAPATLNFEILRDLRLSPTPSIVGSRVVGQTLTASTGDWESGVQLSYQWLRGSMAIDSATASSYQLTGADLGAKISLAVLAEKPGYASITRVSGKTVAIRAATQSSTPTPTISGFTRVGATLQANATGWDAGVALGYQWKRGRSVISGATASSYLLTPADLGSNLTVVVTGTKTATVSASKASAPTVSIAPGIFTLSPTPTLEGTAEVGAILVANPGTWDSGVQLTYQFKRANVAISTATSSVYRLTAADLATQITVTVTATKTGYSTTQRTSAASFAVVSGNLKLTPTPTVVGDATVGQTLLANSGTWDSGTAIAYQWLQSGQVISGATSVGYKLTAANLAKAISVRVTATKPGFNPVVVESAPTGNVATGTLAVTSQPKITGSRTVGYVLSASSGNWESGVLQSYQWSRDGVDISGATARTYLLTGQDFATQISVTVTGSKAGYLTASNTSLATNPIAAGRLTLQPTPTILGSSVVGNTLVAVTGIWDSEVALSYQWKRSGVAIAGATASSYLSGPLDRGSKLSVTVTATKLGFASVVKTSRTLRLGAGN